MFSRFSADQLGKVAKKVNRAVACKARGHEKSAAGDATHAVASDAVASDDTANAATNNTATASVPSASSASGAASVGKPAEASVGQPTDWPSHWASGPAQYREKRERPRSAPTRDDRERAISTVPCSRDDNHTLLKRSKSTDADDEKSVIDKRVEDLKTAPSRAVPCQDWLKVSGPLDSLMHRVWFSTDPLNGRLGKEEMISLIFAAAAGYEQRIWTNCDLDLAPLHCEESDPLVYIDRVAEIPLLQILPISDLIEDVDFIATANAPQHMSDLAGAQAVFCFGGTYADMKMLFIAGRRMPDSLVPASVAACPAAEGQPSAAQSVKGKHLTLGDITTPPDRRDRPVACQIGSEPCKMYGFLTCRAIKIEHPYSDDRICLAQPWLGYFRANEAGNKFMRALAKKLQASMRKLADDVQSGRKTKIDWSDWKNHSKEWMQNTTILAGLVHDTIEISDGRNFQVELVPPHVVCPWPAWLKEPGETKYGYRAPTIQEFGDNPCCVCVPVWKRQFRQAGVLEYLHGLAVAKVKDLLPMSLPHMSVCYAVNETMNAEG